MSRKHFEAVAQVLKDRLELAEAERDRVLPLEGTPGNMEDHSAAAARINEVTDMADALCEVFYAENPRFSRGRFLKACGIN
ncbi:MAG: hypothetical protein JST59_16210 [Actinobacteria bacterium]|nr:hypothetical protein [Actinomycetota bacterium]